jgi:hypothetical protein
VKTWDEIAQWGKIKGKINASKTRQQKDVLQAEYLVADKKC